MFLKTSVLKSAMKDSLKSAGLTVGRRGGDYLVFSDFWGLQTDVDFATNKFKAAIVDLIGAIPEDGKCLRYQIDAEKGITSESAMFYPDPYSRWKEADDFATETPIILTYWPHEYQLFQRKSDGQFLAVNRNFAADIFSAKELDSTYENMPHNPKVENFRDTYGVLYFKNETTVYWVSTVNVGHKNREVLFPHLKGISFFENDWLEKGKAAVAEAENSAAGDEPLPY